jgi:beta-ureidopropionase / N-carbamoyl-L-amino-acid hydrolase
MAGAAMIVSRRRFLEAASAVPVAAFVSPGLIASSQTDALRTDGARLRRQIEALSVFGRPAAAGFADGVSRVGFSDADVAGRAYVIGVMREAGLTPRIDAAGNILARRHGVEPDQPPILFGSHIDSVPNGGNFDGPLGSLAAIEVVRTLAANGVRTRHPLEVVVWANEEGVAYSKPLFGSRAAAGRLVEGELDQVWNDVRKADAVRKIGGDPDRIGTAQRTDGSFHCYFELHIEQGGTLDRAQIPVGIVEGIVSIDRYEAEIRGMANHAGTTVMEERRDALLAASYLTIAVNEIVRGETGRQVGTVGRQEVVPNAPNVVPGLVRQTIELRDLSSETLVRLADAIRAQARGIATRTGTEIVMTSLSHDAGAMASPSVRDCIGAAAERLGRPSQSLPSGAGHDAQSMAALGPMGMIFVPSIDGISHSPRERTSWEHCQVGADVLLQAILQADRSRLTP